MRRAGVHPVAERVLLGAVVLALLACAVVFACAREEVPLVALASSGERTDASMAAGVVSGAVVANAGETAGAQFERTEPTLAAEPLAEAPIDPSLASDLVRALRHDDIPGNCLTACGRLLMAPPGRIEALQSALRSFDPQQRTFAGVILRGRCDAGRAATSEELFLVSVEGLRSDVPINVVGTVGHPLHATSLHFLVAHAAAAAPALRRALVADDAQQRFLAAFALATACPTEDVPRVARELVTRLADNDVRGDALFAGHGLYRLGEAALPTIRLWRPHVDEQARRLLDLIELDLRSPPHDRAESRHRAADCRISTLYHDPVIELDIRRSWVPRL